MTSATPPPAAAQLHQTPPRPKKQPNELTIISHSTLYYWWPVWAFGFLMALITWWEGYVMAILPDVKDPKTGESLTGAAVHADVTIVSPVLNAAGEPEKNDKGEVNLHPSKELKDQVVVYAPQSGDKGNAAVQIKDGNVQPPYLRVSPHKALGVTFVIILLLVLTITNVPMRGMWSVLLIVVAVALTVVFIATGVWETLLSWLWLLDVRINMAGYITISLFLFILWLLAVLVFDKQRYITFTPGQVKVCDEIGGGEQVYSTDGLTLQKQRSDFFRHYVLGLGSGDLIVRTTGAQAHHIDLPNVLFINAKVRQIEELIARKAVVETP